MPSLSPTLIPSGIALMALRRTKVGRRELKEAIILGIRAEGSEIG
jgi:hypothetical protein